VSPHRVRLGIVGAVSLGLLGTVETGLLSPVAVSVAVAVLLYAVGELPDPDPVTKHYVSREAGITEREALDYLTMTNEINKMEEEEVEEARKRAERGSRL